jgi:hypothetical protein
MLAQDDVLPPGATLREVVVGDRPEHDWASDARVRDVLDGLLGGVTASAYREGLATTIATMSGANVAARRLPRCSWPTPTCSARRAHQPPRRGGGRLAGRHRRPPAARTSW